MQVHLATPWCQSCRLPRNVRRPGYVGDMRSEAEVHCAPPCDFFGIRLGMHPNGAVRQSHWVTATAACRGYGSMTAGMEWVQLFPEMRRGNKYVLYLVDYFDRIWRDNSTAT